jgi:hypothetical protein
MVASSHSSLAASSKPWRNFQNSITDMPLPPNTKSNSGFECNWDGYAEQGAAFFRRLKSDPPPTPEQVEAGLKALSLAYIYVNEGIFVGQAAILLNIANRKAEEYLFNLRLAEIDR